MMQTMSETSERRVDEPASFGGGRQSRPGRVAVWVGIVAGVVFVVAVVFFSGFFIGSTSGFHYGSHLGFRDGQMGTGPTCQMGQGGMMGPGMMGPRMSPGGQMEPSQPTPTTSAPAPPRP